MKKSIEENLSLYFIAGTQDCKEKPLLTVKTVWVTPRSFLRKHSDAYNPIAL